jgi:aryl-alcohol dehydrogenase-like predicted oxidoreductase
MWDGATPLEETLSTLDNLVKQGKVRYIGASNFSGWQLQKAVDLSRHMGWEMLSSLQPQYNLLARSTEWELVPVCQNEGLGIICWSPLRGGWLSGKYRRSMEAPPEGSRVQIAEEKGWSESWSAYNNDHTWGVIDALIEVSDQAGKTPAQVAINWLLQRPGVTAPIIGARTMDQLEQNLGSVGWSLDDEQMARLDEASDVQPPYPYGFIERGTRRA